MKTCLIPYRFMNRSLQTLFLVMLIAYSVPAAAQDPPLDLLEDRLKTGPALSDFINYARENNPMIRAGREAWHQSRENIRVSTAYPDPEILMTYWPESMADDLDTKKFEVMLSQSFPFPGKLSAAGKAARAESSLRRLDLDRTARDVAIRIKESFHELSYIRKAMEMAAANQALLNQIRTISETAYADNRGTLIDVMKAQSQSSQSIYDEILLRELEHTETVQLNSLLNRPPDAPVGPLTEAPYQPVPFLLDDIFSMAGKNREEVRMAGETIQKSEAEAGVARFETYPKFKLGLIYEYSKPENTTASGEDMYGVQFGMTLPLWSGKNSGRIGAARAAVEQAKAMENTTINDTMAMVRENFFRLQNAERLIILYRDTLVPQAAHSMETAEVWLRQEQGNMTDYLETQSVWYNFQLALARSKADFGRYLARLEGLAGQPLTMKNEPQPLTVPEAEPADSAFEAQKKHLADMKKEWTGRAKIIPSPATSDRTAEQVLSGSFSPEDLEILAVSRSARVKAAEKDFLSRLEAYDQASVLDDVVRKYSAFNASIMTGVGNMADMESIDKKFPFPGTLSLKGRIVDQEAGLALADLEIAKRTARIDAAQIFHDLAYAAQAKAILRHTLNLLEDLESSASKAYETGQSNILDLTRVTIQKEKIMEELTSVSEQETTAQRQLTALLLLPGKTPVGTPAVLAGNRSVPLPENLIESALIHRQELGKMRIMITRMELMIEMAETQIYPGFSRNLSLTQNQAVNQAGTLKRQEPFGETNAAFTGEGLPINPEAGLFDAYLRETRQRLAALKETLTGAEANTAAEVREAWTFADRAKREFALYHDRIGSLARLDAAVSSRSYESGTMDFSDTMAAILLVQDTRLTAERKKADLGIALARLYGVVGISIAY